jgi:hypothetical protein
MAIKRICTVAKGYLIPVCLRRFLKNHTATTSATLPAQVIKSP